MNSAAQKATQQRGILNERLFGHLPFWSMPYIVCWLSFKGHHELWPDAVDSSFTTPLYPLPPCDQLFRRYAAFTRSKEK